MPTQVKYGLGLYAALFEDIAVWDGELRNPLECELYALETLTETLGHRFLMIDMPEAGKVLDKALSDEQIDPSKLPLSFGDVQTAASRTFLEPLFCRLFDSETGMLRADVETTAVQYLRQVLYLAKKVRKDCSDAAIEAEVETFQRIDFALRPPTLHWDSDELGFPAERVSLLDGVSDPREPDLFDEAVSLSLLRRIESVADNLTSRFKSEFDWRTLLPKHGPGSVADARTGTDKYLFPTWPAKLDGVFPHTYFCWSSEILAFDGLTHHTPSVNEVPARLLAVPKTLKAPRMIASEPVSHQFIQLGLMRWLRENLPEPLTHCLDFRSQEPSRALCKEASRAGALATVDLSSASDRLSCWVVERIFRRAPALLEAFHASRTRTLVNATGVGEPYMLLLKKYAPMGNGTTFPVQSIVYAIIAIAAVLENRRLRVTNRNIYDVCREIRVFGDDIILPSPAVPDLAHAFEYLQLKVNVMKTHDVGLFRESCGMDAFRGAEVTPLYLADLELRDTPLSLISWLDVLKNAHARRNMYHFTEAMRDMLPSKIRHLLPMTQRNIGCLTQPGIWDDFSNSETRFNRRLQRMEVMGLVVESPPVTKLRETDANLVQYWTDHPSPDSPWSAGYSVRRRSVLRKRWVPMY